MINDHNPPAARPAILASTEYGLLYKSPYGGETESSDRLKGGEHAQRRVWSSCLFPQAQTSELERENFHSMAVKSILGYH